jgi:hypothetical protein
MSIQKRLVPQSQIPDSITSLHTSKEKPFLAAEGDQVNAQEITMHY